MRAIVAVAAGLLFYAGLSGCQPQKNEATQSASAAPAPAAAQAADKPCDCHPAAAPAKSSHAKNASSHHAGHRMASWHGRHHRHRYARDWQDNYGDESSYSYWSETSNYAGGPDGYDIEAYTRGDYGDGGHRRGHGQAWVDGYGHRYYFSGGEVRHYKKAWRHGAEYRAERADPWHGYDVDCDDN